MDYSATLFLCIMGAEEVGDVMIRGTTPLHTFTLPFDGELIKKLRLIYAQDGAVLYKKTEADCTIKDSKVSIRLTQEETLMARANEKLKMQIRVLDDQDHVIATGVMWVAVADILDDEVL